ncbi:Ribosomal protein L7/L12 C-terminal domain-containing protein [Mucilaginibacter pineti]|uniref:Ribosomal protein L7/L12 C-terminal domain-containing protein n=1 Tax=Mucilaginibacter pineti TaxID=1391627 RepID=A0A1G7GDS9_9SPHI|nr:CFI-box-CTERM domain-containing protein [Mucilaginibacter pineti]SDE86169.1 Ribosomal protein L7/L12 C-terminal domain-containing protein [Mucilaginibacter pineti]
MTISKEIEQQIELLLSQNRKLEAVKLVVDTTHCGLKDAKEFVDNFKSEGFFDSTKPASKRDIDSELLKLLADGNKLSAVKLYKEATGLGLAESKDYVENLQARGFKSASDPLAPPTWASSSKKRDTQIDELVMDQNAKTKSGCFIATACYGDYDAAEVLVLRKFRDERLMQSFAGKVFVQFYYAISPFLAKQIDKSDALKKYIRNGILNPIIARLQQSEK